MDPLQHREASERDKANVLRHVINTAKSTVQILQLRSNFHVHVFLLQTIMTT